MERMLVCGAGGFIGSHLVKRLKDEGYWVKGVDLKYPQFSKTHADDFIIGDLRDPRICKKVTNQPFDEVYQLAADMGGAGFVFSGENDADIMHNSALINLNMVEACYEAGVKKIFYSSSACIYPEYNQMDPGNPKCSEDSAYPAAPDSEYGWEKLFSEHLYLAFRRNYGMDVRIARFHNIFGPEGSWNDGREKAPAAFCRKVAETPDGGEIDMWGDGFQTRSFLYIDECLEGVRRLMKSDFIGPVNIGSEEMVSINRLAEIIMGIAGKKLSIKHIPGPLGVRGRNSDNRLLEEKLGWKPSAPLVAGMEKTYRWIKMMVEKDRKSAQKLKEQLAEEKVENVEIVEGDILKFSIFHPSGGRPQDDNFQFSNKKNSNPLNPPLQGGQESTPLAQKLSPSTPLTQRGVGGLNHPYKVVANIPYYLTSHLIRLLLESANPPTDIILMIQKEVARRICSKPPYMSLLALSVQFYAEVKIIATVSKNSFWPKPEVDSAIIKITPRQWGHPDPAVAGEGSPANANRTFVQDSSVEFTPHSDAGPQNDKINTENFFRVLRAGFSHPRKQLLNNLSSGLAIPRDQIAAILQTAGLAPEQRAETLSVKDWIKLTKLFFYQTSDKKP